MLLLNIANYCNECGNCNTFCPTNRAPYKEKPKFWLTKQSFDLSILEINFKSKEVKEINFTLATEMSILLEAAKKLVFE